RGASRACQRRPRGTELACLSPGPNIRRALQMTMSNRRVYGGLYADRDAAERGIRRFHEAGYDRNRIGIIARDRDAAGKLAEDTGAGVAGGAATGAVAGGILGGLAGLLVGTGALAIPGIGPVVAAGVWASTLGTAGATAGAGAGIG